MIGVALRDAARELLRGEITFELFMKRSREDWARLARWLYRKCGAPPAVTVEDVEQELGLQATRAWQRGFDPRRSEDLGKYLVFIARDKTITWLHGQTGRRMHGNPWKRAPQIPVPASWLDDPGEPGAPWIDTVAGDDRDQLARAKARQHVEAIAGLASPHEGRVLDALLDADGDVAIAASVLYGDADYKVEHWLVGDRAAYKHVEKTLASLRKKIEGVTRIPVSGSEETLAAAG